MNTVFLKLLNMSIAAGWLILAVIILRLLLKRAPKWLTCTLWGIVAVRLLCPFSLESPFGLIPDTETLSPDTVQYAKEPAIHSGISSLDSAVNPLLGEAFSPAPGASVNPLYIWISIAGMVWALGCIGLLGYAIVSLLRMYGSLREAVPFEDNIWLCDSVKSPFILGILRPKIYLPSGTDPEHMEYILAHEQAHLKRRDYWWKPLGFLLLAVYWFQPLVWAAYILFCRDIELACDEKVIKDMNLEKKKAYSYALVACSMQKRMVLTYPLAFGEIGVKERVKNIFHYKKPAFWTILAGTLTCAVVAVCFLTNPRQDTFAIKIVVPAGSGQGTYYSEEEISPTWNVITLSADEGWEDNIWLHDAEVSLSFTEINENQEIFATYLHSGYSDLPMKVTTEKGNWFRIGITTSNPTNEDMVVYIRAKGVVVRIADAASPLL